MQRPIKASTAALFTFWCFFTLTGASHAQIPLGDLHKIENAVPSEATVAPKQPRKLLVFTLEEGFKHSSTPYAAKALELMGKKTGAFEVVQSQEMSIFKPESLKQFDAVLFANTTQLKFEDRALRHSLMQFIKSGKGIVGLHAATDNFYTWPEAANMMGGQFDGHPWNASGTWAVNIEDPKHPLTAAFNRKNFRIKDEIYRIRQRSLRANSRVLVGLDMTDEVNLSAEGVRFADKDIPISWIRGYGKGRVFYSSFGHNHAIYWNPVLLRHFLDGIQFAMGDLPVDTTPNRFDVTQALGFEVLEDLLTKIAVYEYGQSREPLVNLTEFLRMAQASPKGLKRIEKRLLNVLKSDATLAGKQFICDRLSIIGTKESVKTLAKMLPDIATSDMARFALERIPHTAVDKALRKALSRTDGKQKAGIINSLGQRRDTRSVSALLKLLDDPDPIIATAAIAALGEIADSKATKALAQAKEKMTGELRMKVLPAYLKCADRLLEKGEELQALAIYKQLNNPAEPPPIRFAALKGMIRSAGDQANEMILTMLKADDSQMQTVASGLVKEIPVSQSIAGIVREIPHMLAASQVQLLTSLAERHDAESRQASMDAIESDYIEVRIAALKALAKVGNESAVPLLARSASEASTGEERKVARESLYRLRGSNIDQAIVDNISVSKPEVKAELIRSVDRRQIHTAVRILFQTAKDSDRKVRIESVKALKTLAGSETLPELIGLLVNTQSAAERTELEKTVAAVSLKIPEESRRSEAVMKALSSVTKVESRSSLFNVLGKIGDRTSLPVLRAALDDTVANLKTAAVRAFAAWPSAEPLDDLLEIAQNSDNTIRQVLALRGFVRLLGLESDRPDEVVIEMFKLALDLAANTNEKKMVLSGISNIGSMAALEVASTYLEDPALRQEAEVAVVRIAKDVSGSNPENTKKVLEKVIQITNSDSLPHISDARQMLTRIERFEDYMTVWQVSGPYTQKDVNVFGFAFAPEQIDARNVTWQIMPAGTNKEKPWLLELDKVLGGETRVAYLRNRVWSDMQQPVRLELGSDDGVKAWLNDELVHENNTTRGVTPGEDVVEVTLKKGWNSLLLKISQGGGGWGACARFRNLDGGRVEGLKVALPETKVVE